MTWLHAIILANIGLVIFNVCGMTAGFKPPPLAAFGAIWIALVIGLHVASN